MILIEIGITFTQIFSGFVIFVYYLIKRVPLLFQKTKSLRNFRIRNSSKIFKILRMIRVFNFIAFDKFILYYELLFAFSILGTFNGLFNIPILIDTLIR